MKAMFFIMMTAFLAGCITLPEFDGTSRDVPAVDEYRFTVKFSSKDEIQQKCRSKSFVGGKLVIEDNARPVDACAITARNQDYYETEIYIEPPIQKEDAYCCHIQWDSLFVLWSSHSLKISSSSSGIARAPQYRVNPFG